MAKNAVPSYRKINGKTLTQDVQLTAADVNAATQEMLRVEIPVGVPLPWPTETAPSGWLICNGQTFNKTIYPQLAIAYPSGALPDLRGEFIRGWDDGRGVDAGRTLLSAQSDAIRNITGSIQNMAHGLTASVTATGVFTQQNGGYTGNATGSGRTDIVLLDASKQVPTANENRPRNIAFNYIVRAA